MSSCTGHCNMCVTRCPFYCTSTKPLQSSAEVTTIGKKWERENKREDFPSVSLLYIRCPIPTRLCLKWRARWPAFFSLHFDVSRLSLRWRFTVKCIVLIYRLTVWNPLTSASHLPCNWPPLALCGLLTLPSPPFECLCARDLPRYHFQPSEKNSTTRK